MTTTPDFLDKLTGFFQNAIASIQENVQLRSENAQLKAANTELTSKLEAISSSLSQDEQEKADTAAKLSSLEQLLAEYESTSAPVAVAA
ncbi:MAG: hypothetical protein V7K21_13395 [Nostoc sp.]|uniref:hypothetical protein n=1 Tax=Nostoc sp. TaxID=1180 RepID=UPI002FFBD504